jgi:TolA-binding protein
MFFLRRLFFLFNGLRPLHPVSWVPVVSLLLVLVIFDRPAFCAKIAWWQYPQREQIEIVFPTGTPTPEVRRIDPLTVRILAIQKAWGPPRELILPAFTGANLLRTAVAQEQALLVQLQSKAFGFVTQYDKASGRLTVDFFPDPLGKRWVFAPPAPKEPTAPRTDQARVSPALPLPPSQPQEIPAPPNLSTAADDLAEQAPLTAPNLPEPVLPEPVLTDAQDATATPGPSPASGEIRRPLRPPPIHSEQTVLPAPAASVFRARIERIGPEDARSVQQISEGAEPLVVAIPETPRTEPEPLESKAEVQPPPAASTEPSLEIKPENDGQPTVESTKDRPGDLPAAEEEAEGVDPHAEHRRQLASARDAMMNAKFEEAVRILRSLTVQAHLPEDLREEIFYDLGDALFSKHLDDLSGNFAAVVDAYEQALHLYPKSVRAATALRNLGVAHLRANNLLEAKAYFNILRREHPHDPLLPTADYYLGDYFLKRGDYDQAAGYFQTVVQKYPEHSIVQQSSVGLARALHSLGFDEQASQVMNFLEKRWPRYYIDDPSLLELAGIIALREGNLEKAKQRLLTYYNLVPDTPNAHMLLARLGDIYLLTGKPDAARHVFEKTAQMYPDEEGGLIAQMRLVEGGIYDDLSLLDDLFTTMRAAETMRAVEVYTRIIEKHPQSPLAAVATIKLAIWQVWNNRLEDSLATARGFLIERPQHSLAPKALETGLEAFSRLVNRNLPDGRYAEIINVWNLNEFLHPLEPDLDVKVKLGLAMAFWKTGDHERALELARPHLQGTVPHQAQGIALDLILGILLEQQQWQQIADLEPLRKELELSADRLREFNYALALALENLGRAQEARPYWLTLAEDLRLGQAQRGFALYFLARSAMRDEELEKVYIYAQEALSLLLLEHKDSVKIRDCIAWLTQVTERTGRLQEALAWALEFDQLINENDPDWAMSRYRLAQLYQRMQDHEQWRMILLDLQQKDPHGLYGRLARSALQGRELKERAAQFEQQ